MVLTAHTVALFFIAPMTLLALKKVFLKVESHLMDHLDTNHTVKAMPWDALMDLLSHRMQKTQPQLLNGKITSILKRDHVFNTWALKEKLTKKLMMVMNMSKKL